MLIRAASHVIAGPTPPVMIRSPRRIESLGICLVSFLTARMWVRTEIRVTPSSVRNMGIELGRPEVGMPKHLLHAAQVGAPLEEVGGERMPEKVGMHAGRVEAGLLG